MNFLEEVETHYSYEIVHCLGSGGQVSVKIDFEVTKRVDCVCVPPISCSPNPRRFGPTLLSVPLS